MRIKKISILMIVGGFFLASGLSNAQEGLSRIMALAVMFDLVVGSALLIVALCMVVLKP
jgi:hypothetical protein